MIIDQSRHLLLYFRLYLDFFLCGLPELAGCVSNDCNSFSSVLHPCSANVTISSSSAWFSNSTIVFYRSFYWHLPSKNVCKQWLFVTIVLISFSFFTFTFGRWFSLLMHTWILRFNRRSTSYFDCNSIMLRIRRHMLRMLRYRNLLIVIAIISHYY